MSESLSYKRRFRNVAPAVQQVASDLQKVMTTAEVKLWKAVRDRALDGIKIRRQYPVDRFVLDFYVPSSKLAIEIDGAAHLNQKERDLERTAFLASRGIRVIRFSNDDVIYNLQTVLEIIRIEAVNKK
jgi:very-short-patch-repair endonuclease